MGNELASYNGGKRWGRSAICNWERVERGEPMPKKLWMSDHARAAYRGLVVNLAEAQGLQVRAKLGPRVWRFEILCQCRTCEKWFVMDRPGVVNCKRHRS